MITTHLIAVIIISVIMGGAWLAILIYCLTRPRRPNTEGISMHTLELPPHESMTSFVSRDAR
ncbi:hypothetical protein EVJ58_g3827 [Rhodofomes roseus]|uniref:Uncharacterized protein n=1 Tax=Rhodofomes roseus TaxID=34475 RepID=A0A4Y9YNB7_9APHY|nr:hypothetical protein EVJ58_g3827 [Rhodofomes roseus]